jgi:two-component system response regulator YesN
VAANLISVNYTNFSIMFSKETGVSFVDYLRQVRIEKARELIRTTIIK